MVISLIVAMSKNHVIGVDNQLPWHLPVDLKYFKETTMGKPIVMGRKTFQSIGRPLPGRENIVLTREATFKAPGCWITGDIESVLKKYADTPELMITGGAQIFEQTLSLAQRLYITYVDVELKGETFFPYFDMAEWKEIARTMHLADEKNKYNCTFCIFERIKG